MPSVFKMLASIAVWVLFVNGCLGIVLSAVSRLVTGQDSGPLVAWAIGVVSLFLAVAAIKLRHALE